MSLSKQILESQKLENLDSALGVTRWTAYKKYFPNWETCQTSLHLRFLDQLQRARNRLKRQNRPQEHLEHCYGAWKLVPRTEWVPRFGHTQALAAENRYKEVGPRHANVSRDKEITQSRPRGLAQNAKRAKLTVWSQNLPAYSEGHSHDKGHYCDAAVVLVALQHKNRSLEHC